MLYLVTHAETEHNSQLFDEPLSPKGSQQSVDLAQLFNVLGVQVVYAAPYRRALDTVKFFITERKRKGEFVRAEVHYDICNGIFLPEQQPHSLSMERVQDCGLNRQLVMGNMPQPESFDNYRRRILDWFTNEFLSKYEDAPIPTVIVADTMTLAIITYYIMNKMSYTIAKQVVNSLRYASVHEFRSNGFRLDYSRQVQ